MISKNIEDYLEAIHDSLKEKSHAGTREVAERLGVKQPSVTEMFQKLESMGLVKYEKYKGVTLTGKGEKIAKHTRSTHNAIRKLLEVLQVPKEQADEDACGIEHHLSGKTIEQLEKFLKFIENCPKGVPDWMGHFKHYSKTGKYPEECEGDER